MFSFRGFPDDSVWIEGGGYYEMSVAGTKDKSRLAAMPTAEDTAYYQAATGPKNGWYVSKMVIERNVKVGVGGPIDKTDGLAAFLNPLGVGYVTDLYVEDVFLPGLHIYISDGSGASAACIYLFPNVMWYQEPSGESLLTGTTFNRTPPVVRNSAGQIVKGGGASWQASDEDYVNELIDYFNELVEYINSDNYNHKGQDLELSPFNRTTDYID